MANPVAEYLRDLADQIAPEPGPLWPAMAVSEWLLAHACAAEGRPVGTIEPPTAAIDPAQLDGLRNSLVLAFTESEVVAAYDADGNRVEGDFTEANTEEAERMAEVAMAAITHTVVR